VSGLCVLAALGFLVASVTGGQLPSRRSASSPTRVSTPTGPVVPAPGHHRNRTGVGRPSPASLLHGSAVAPSFFQPGACRIYPPTHADRHLTVFIDAGHGGVDPGAVGQAEDGQTVHEADLTLRVEMDAAALLRADGFTVVVSRTRDSLVGRLAPADFSGKLLSPAGVHADVAARDHCADLAHAAALVGIYFDAGYSSYNAGSLTAYDRARPFWHANRRLAQLVQRDVLASLNAHGWAIPDDGVVSDVSLGGPALDAASATYGHLLLLGPGVPRWFTTPSDMPGALIEPLYVTDPFEAQIAAGANGQRAIASGIARAVEQFFSPAPVAKPPRPVVASQGTTTTTGALTFARS
jgi:N-acetylmuramoyl-L-alanine amidase